MSFVICSLDFIDNGYKRSGLWGWTWVGRWVVIGCSFYGTSCVSFVHVSLHGCVDGMGCGCKHTSNTKGNVHKDKGSIPLGVHYAIRTKELKFTTPLFHSQD